VSRKRVVPREFARRDVDAAIDFYIREAGPDIALGFINALTFDALSARPWQG
jgi:toxin ParE1/3/4